MGISCTKQTSVVKHDGCNTVVPLSTTSTEEERQALTRTQPTRVYETTALPPHPPSADSGRLRSAAASHPQISPFHTIDAAARSNPPTTFVEKQLQRQRNDTCNLTCRKTLLEDDAFPLQSGREQHIRFVALPALPSADQIPCNIRRKRNDATWNNNCVALPPPATWKIPTRPGTTDVGDAQHRRSSLSDPKGTPPSETNLPQLPTFAHLMVAEHSGDETLASKDAAFEKVAHRQWVISPMSTSGSSRGGSQRRMVVFEETVTVLTPDGSFLEPLSPEPAEYRSQVAQSPRRQRSSMASLVPRR